MPRVLLLLYMLAFYGARWVAFRLVHRRYLRISRYVLEHLGARVEFSTEDLYSKGWFYPRYDGGKLHEEGVTRLLAAEVQRARCFVDVGAHLGYYTCLAAKLMPPGAQVHAFELDAVNFALLERNVSLNASHVSVELHLSAATDRASRLTYWRLGNLPNSMLGADSFVRGVGHPIEARATTLDAVFASGPQPDLIKIDVEGSELRTLLGMDRILREARPLLFLEVHPDFEESVHHVPGLLRRYGYTLHEVTAHRTQTGDAALRELPMGEALRRNTMLLARPREA